ncbi:MAG: ATP synthase F1 subunit delta [Armatimonadetes bacterium]|nr:ATP synthase F1 subunit delta [Armatimonadota bacterium]MDW8122959.1 ATP synthase F1 subunit delta [Armatimonadota bacterium]
MPRALTGGKARRYAAALLEAAVKAGQLDQVEKELEEWERLVTDQPAIGRFLSHPGQPAGRKIQFLRQRLGGRVSSITLNFLITLVRRGRSDALPHIRMTFQDLVREWRKEAVALVISAVPLTEQERKMTLERLTTLTGKRIILNESVDPSVLGGLRIVVGDKLIDLTVRAHLNHIRSILKQVFFVSASQGTNGDGAKN